MTAFDPSWTYDPDAGFPYRDYEASPVALTPFDEYSSEDTITGGRDGKAFLCVEIHTRVWRGRGDQRRLVTRFRGLFIRVPLNLPAGSRTLVVDQAARRADDSFLADLIERWRLSRDPVVQLEDPDFERSFTVHASDPVAAHALPTPWMMAGLTQLRCRTGRTVSLALVDGVATMAVGCDRDLFEPGAGTDQSRRDVAALVAVLSVIAGLVERMPMPAPVSPSVVGTPSAGRARRVAG